MAHAKLAPSAAHRWLSCPGSVALSEGILSTSSVYAEEGTRAHNAAACLLNDSGYPPQNVSDEMLSYVGVYTDAIRRAAEGKLLFVEVPVDISMWTGEAGGKGTADAVIVSDGAIEVHDLKYGMGHIVDAEHNEQLMIYALGTLDLIEEIIGKVTEVKLVIHQPRRDHLSEWTVSREDLMNFGEYVRAKARVALTCDPGNNLYPSDKACLWCPAKATCPALREAVYAATAADFTDIEEGPYPTPDALGLVEMWLGAVKQAIFEKLQAFEPVPGWKLVKGREGNRKWQDEGAVEELLKSFRVPKGESHNMTVKSPAQLEKVGLAPKKWAQVEGLITRSEAKPVMVAESDPRPAVEQAKAEEFDLI